MIPRVFRGCYVKNILFLLLCHLFLNVYLRPKDKNGSYVYNQI